ncbi:ABC transporter substrate-binding protein [Streptomyces sp. AS02]|uniref:ABC transporter substrate-binding protein n=1 Tax=Streptomyces sp. AS02 TaxID=2938946 RepID=UPI0020226246|nr:ABC transporter substrate-binding protein [Streptomyces sp. AS02]MCL8017258.1 ABC transporter substrate-binding protein [Streptomyces sp. AS02]
MSLGSRTARVVVAATTTLAVGAGLAACSGSTPATQSDSTFTIAYTQAPNSVDPATAAPASFVWAAYEPLIHRDNDGSLQPALATKWKYLDDENKSFEITLRSGVTFSDGDALTAEAVNASINRFLKLPDNADVRYAGDIDSIEVTGEHTLVIHYGASNPAAAVSLTQDYKMGLVISPTGLKDEDALTTETHGAGQYVLDTTDSVSGSKYVFERNDTYWNQKAVKFDSVVQTVLPDASAQLSALRSGQADALWNTSADNVATAKKAGFTYTSAGGDIQLLMLEDREGKPLNDPLVREAFMYALDRKAIAESIYSGLATPAYSLAGPDSAGAYDAQEIEQDTDKAKQLLKEAGYADGITVSVLSSGGWDPNHTLATALQQQLAESGITVELKSVGAALSDFITPLMSTKYQSAQFGLSAGADTYFQLTTNAYGAGALANVQQTRDTKLDSLLKRAAASQGEEYESLLRQAVERYDSLHYVIPIVTSNSHYLVAKDVSNVPTGSVQQQLDAFAPDADESWGLSDASSS